MTAHASELGISGIEFEGCRYISFHMQETREDFLSRLAVATAGGVRAEDLVFPSEHPLFDKYDAFIPAELLRKAYARDRLDPAETRERLDEILSE